MSADITDFDVIETMIHLGGSFVRALGHAWRAADTDNRARLRAAFPEYWDRYKELAALKLPPEADR